MHICTSLERYMQLHSDVFDFSYDLEYMQYCNYLTNNQFNMVFPTKLQEVHVTLFQIVLLCHRKLFPLSWVSMTYST